MSDIPSLPLFIDDFEAATAHLTLEEDGTYNRLLRLCWRQSGCSIPDDDDWIRRRMRVSEEDYLRVVKPIIDEFFSREKGRIFQRRLRAEHEYVLERISARKEAGKKGGLAKAKKTRTKEPSKAKNLPAEKSSKTLAPNPRPTPIPDLEDSPPTPQRGDAREARDGGDLFNGDLDPPEPSPRERMVALVGEDRTREFIAMRKQIKKAPTERAILLIANKLAKMRDPGRAVDESIVHCWQDVYDPDEKRQNGGNVTRFEPRSYGGTIDGLTGSMSRFETS